MSPLFLASALVTVRPWVRFLPDGSVLFNAGLWLTLTKISTLVWGSLDNFLSISLLVCKHGLFHFLV